MTEIKKLLIFEKIAKSLADIKAIGKNSINTHQGFKFRGIDDVYNSIHDVFAKNEIFTVPEIVEEKTENRENSSGKVTIYRILKIKYTVFATDGSSLSGTVMGEAMDYGDKAANKAMSAAHKYFLTQLLCVPFENMPDGDSDSYEIKASKSFNLEDTTKQINNAKTMDELKEIFSKSWKLAKSSSQQDADAIKDLYDAKKADIGGDVK